MEIKNLIGLILCSTVFLFSSCSGNKNIQLKGIECVRIGTQVWMAKNLDVDTFRNGDSIFEAKTNEEWLKACKTKQAAWCFYNNHYDSGIKFGKLYNWYAVSDKRGLAPNGWRIPNNKDWFELGDKLGNDAGREMKSMSGWKPGLSGDGNGNNWSGFNALSAGLRYCDGEFGAIGTHSCWWSLSDSNYFYVNYFIHSFFRGEGNNGSGHSVRCIKD